MSVVKLFDTNTIFEPIQLCMCDKKYKVDGGKILKYSIENIKGQKYLCVSGIKILPLVEIKK